MIKNDENQQYETKENKFYNPKTSFYAHQLQEQQILRTKQSQQLMQSSHYHGDSQFTKISIMKESRQLFNNQNTPSVIRIIQLNNEKNNLIDSNQVTHQPTNMFRSIRIPPANSFEQQMNEKQKRVATNSTLQLSQQQNNNKQNENFKGNTLLNSDCSKEQSFVIKQLSSPKQATSKQPVQSVIQVGLPNEKLTCYLNSSLQALRQIYFYRKEFFKRSEFGNLLYTLYERMEFTQKADQKILSQIFHVYSKYQTQISWGDSYACLIDLLYELQSQMKGDVGNRKLFEEYFVTKVSHQLYCQKCKSPLENTDDLIASHYEEHLSFEFPSLSDLFSNNSYLQIETQVKCLRCRKLSIPLSQVSYQSTPKFLFVKVTVPNQYQNPLSFQISRQQQDYKIIGFSSFKNHHYTYYAQYNNQWYEFNDMIVKQVNQPNNNNVQYYLLEKRD